MTDTDVMNKTGNKASQEDTLRQVLEILQKLPTVNSASVSSGLQIPQPTSPARAR
jgi:hypothetical protein